MTGNKTIDNALIGISVLATGIALGIFIYTEIVFERPLPNDLVEKKLLLEDSKKIVFSESFKVEKLIINLSSSSSRLRYLEVQTYLVPFKNEYNEILESRRPMIHDVIIDLAGQISPNQLNTIAGKVLLESRIKNELNKKLGKFIVKEIYFAKFVVQ